ncbi:hypothetical protein BJ165DRAFT_1534589 [Panaeolus papilionaceus]|nr:hypothetical protein BJ165DRAFT_1534589 [Panaeolus papilionaceus]
MTVGTSTSFGPEHWLQRRAVWSTNPSPLPDDRVTPATALPGPSVKTARPRKPDALIPPWLWFAVRIAFSCVVIVAAALNRSLHSNRRLILNVYRDGIGLVDYASPFNNATLLPELTTSPKDLEGDHFYLFEATGPSSVLGPGSGVLVPGLCWLIKGGVGQIGIRFVQPIRVSHITIDHIPGSLAPLTSNAPQQVKVWGWQMNSLHHLLPEQSSGSAGEVLFPKIAHPQYHLYPLKTIQYDIHARNNVQTFDIRSNGYAFLSQGVAIEISGGWGGTGCDVCLYRIRIHGLLGT